MKNLSKIILHTLKENCGQDNATPTSQKCTAIQLVESISYSSCKYKVDRILRLKISNLE